jgi:hypothetical protein
VLQRPSIEDSRAIKLPPTMASSKANKASGDGGDKHQESSHGRLHARSMVMRGSFDGREFGGDEDSLRKQGWGVI